LLLRKMRRCGAWSSYFGNDAVAVWKRAGSPLKCGPAKRSLMIKLGIYRLPTSCGPGVGAPQVEKVPVRIAFVNVPGKLFHHLRVRAVWVLAFPRWFTSVVVVSADNEKFSATIEGDVSFQRADGGFHAAFRVILPLQRARVHGLDRLVFRTATGDSAIETALRACTDHISEEHQIFSFSSIFYDRRHEYVSAVVSAAASCRRLAKTSGAGLDVDPSGTARAQGPYAVQWRSVMPIQIRARQCSTASAIQEATDQKTSFNPSWTIRSESAITDVICPTCAEEMFAFGSIKFTLLNRLKNSARNCSFMRS
jgi:hypothetical protein